jgi:tetrahydromethanopterin S-methyltransferase subunit D
MNAIVIEYVPVAELPAALARQAGQGTGCHGSTTTARGARIDAPMLIDSDVPAWLTRGHVGAGKRLHAIDASEDAAYERVCQ